MNLLTIYLQNFHSIRNKAISVSDFAASNNIDILALTETWLNETETTVIANLVPVGYTFQHVPRPAGIGGGVGLLFKSGLTVKTRTSTKDKLYTHFEHMDCNVSSGSSQFTVGVIYRPPSSSKNRLKTSTFFEEWASYLETFTSKEDRLILMGILTYTLITLMTLIPRDLTACWTSMGYDSMSLAPHTVQDIPLMW